MERVLVGGATSGTIYPYAAEHCDCVIHVSAESNLQVVSCLAVDLIWKA